MTAPRLARAMVRYEQVGEIPELDLSSLDAGLDRLKATFLSAVDARRALEKQAA